MCEDTKDTAKVRKSAVSPPSSDLDENPLSLQTLAYGFGCVVFCFFSTSTRSTQEMGGDKLINAGA